MNDVIIEEQERQAALARCAGALMNAHHGQRHDIPADVWAELMKAVLMMKAIRDSATAK